MDCGPDFLTFRGDMWREQPPHEPRYDHDAQQLRGHKSDAVLPGDDEKSRGVYEPDPNLKFNMRVEGLGSVWDGPHFRRFASQRALFLTLSRKRISHAKPGHFVKRKKYSGSLKWDHHAIGSVRGEEGVVVEEEDVYALHPRHDPHASEVGADMAGYAGGRDRRKMMPTTEATHWAMDIHEDKAQGKGDGEAVDVKREHGQHVAGGVTDELRELVLGKRADSVTSLKGEMNVKVPLLAQGEAEDAVDKDWSSGRVIEIYSEGDPSAQVRALGGLSVRSLSKGLEAGMGGIVGYRQRMSRVRAMLASREARHNDVWRRYKETKKEIKAECEQMLEAAITELKQKLAGSESAVEAELRLLVSDDLGAIELHELQHIWISISAACTKRVTAISELSSQIDDVESHRSRRIQSKLIEVTDMLVDIAHATRGQVSSNLQVHAL
ncbi:hypothetical protein CBR_g29567 [Chara braunii]|uniref:DUF4455 domain-containing protein n=1 Tax=Chara braunii TaxID=69332 RepID=A0A388LAT0_CHABU|nr:hypothetical protein CBR_g29567 [Chara braunii]|eukprot:GBG79420.1 hypothetical protein CBR_g29567 [Chara braunii]